MLHQWEYEKVRAWIITAISTGKVNLLEVVGGTVVVVGGTVVVVRGTVVVVVGGTVVVVVAKKYSNN